MKYLSNGKINLFLNVIGKRNDGYHLLESLFSPITLSDEISVMKSDKLKCEVENINIDDNIALSVAKKLKVKFNIQDGAHIIIKKNIPIASGLGGGSSNAANVLKLLCKLWNIEMTSEQMIDYGVTIGADVPFFIKNKTAIIQGIGEKITPMSFGKKLHLLLVNPNVHVSTSQVFKMGFEKFSPNEIFTDSNYVYKLIFQGKNDLAANAIKIAPVIKDVLLFISQKSECMFSRLSGSGATCFGIFTTQTDALNAYNALPKEWWGHYEELVV